MEKMRAIHQMPISDHKRTPLPVNNTNMTDKEHMTSSEKKVPSFPENDTNIHSDENITDEKKKRGNVLPTIYPRSCLQLKNIYIREL